MMADTISRQAAIDCVTHVRFGMDKLAYGIVTEALLNLPPVEPEHKVGKWVIFQEFDDGCQYARCNQCRDTQVFYRWTKIPKYCPNCGVKMEGRNE